MILEELKPYRYFNFIRTLSMPAVCHISPVMLLFLQDKNVSLWWGLLQFNTEDFSLREVESGANAAVNDQQLKIVGNK